MSDVFRRLRPLVTGRTARELDRLAVEELGFTSATLMESAGRGAWHALLSPDIATAWRRRDRDARVLVLCGKGHNAGDALVCARYLAIAGGVQVDVALLAPPGRLAGETALNLERLRRFHPSCRIVAGPDALPLRQALCETRYDVILDGLLGIGIRGDVGVPCRDAIQELNEHRERFGVCVVAMDVPSGLDADTGRRAGVAVKADHTITFGPTKIGLLLGEGPELCGRVHPIPLPFPSLAGDHRKEPRVDRLFDLGDRESAPPRIPRLGRPDRNRHKYDQGAVFVVGGSPGLTGAVRMSARSAWEKGAGAVLVACPEGLLSTLSAADVFPILHPVGVGEGRGSFIAADAAEVAEWVRSRSGALLVGPGLGADVHTTGFVPELLSRLPDVPTVVDADGLRGWDPAEILPAGGRSAPLVLTPHPGEAEGLFGRPAGGSAIERIELAREAAIRHGVHICSKGDPVAVLTPGGGAVIGAYSSRAFNRAGAGDTLAGRSAANLSFGSEPLHAVLDALLEGLESLHPQQRSGRSQGSGSMSPEPRIA